MEPGLFSLSWGKRFALYRECFYTFLAEPDKLQTLLKSPSHLKMSSLNSALWKEHWYVFRSEAVFFQGEEIAGRDGKLLIFS